MQRHDNYIAGRITGAWEHGLPLEDLLFLIFKVVEDSVTVYAHYAL